MADNVGQSPGPSWTVLTDHSSSASASAEEDELMPSSKGTTKYVPSPLSQRSGVKDHGGPQIARKSVSGYAPKRPSGANLPELRSKQDKEKSRKRKLSLAFNSSDVEEAEPRRSSITMGALASRALGDRDAQGSSSHRFLQNTSFGRLLAKTGSQSATSSSVTPANRSGLIPPGSASVHSQQGVSVRRVPKPVASNTPQVEEGSKKTTADPSDSSDDSLPEGISAILDEYDMSQPSVQIPVPSSSRRSTTGHQSRRISGPSTSSTAARSTQNAHSARGRRSPAPVSQQRNPTAVSHEVIEFDSDIEIIEPVKSAQGPAVKNCQVPPDADVIIIESDDEEITASPLKRAVKMQLKVDKDGTILISDEEDDAPTTALPMNPTSNDILSAISNRVEHPASPVFVADALSQEGAFGDPSSLLMGQPALDEIQNPHAAPNIPANIVSPTNASSNGSPTLQNQFEDMTLSLSGSGVPEVAEELDNLTMSDGGGNMDSTMHPEGLAEAHAGASSTEVPAKAPTPDNDLPEGALGEGSSRTCQAEPDHIANHPGSVYTPDVPASADQALHVLSSSLKEGGEESVPSAHPVSQSAEAVHNTSPFDVRSSLSSARSKLPRSQRSRNSAVGSSSLYGAPDGFFSSVYKKRLSSSSNLPSDSGPVSANLPWASNPSMKIAEPSAIPLPRSQSSFAKPREQRLDSGSVSSSNGKKSNISLQELIRRKFPATAKASTSSEAVKLPDNMDVDSRPVTADTAKRHEVSSPLEGASIISDTKISATIISTPLESLQQPIPSPPTIPTKVLPASDIQKAQHSLQQQQLTAHTRPSSSSSRYSGDEHARDKGANQPARRPSIASISSVGSGSVSSLADAINSMKAPRADRAYSQIAAPSTSKDRKPSSTTSTHRISPIRIVPPVASKGKSKSRSKSPNIVASMVTPDIDTEDAEVEASLTLNMDHDMSDAEMSDERSYEASSSSRESSSQPVSDGGRRRRSKRLALLSNSADSSSMEDMIEFSQIETTRPRIFHSPPARGDSRGIASTAYDMAAFDQDFNIIKFNSTMNPLVAKEFASFSQLAKDLPHEIEDELNSLPLYARQADNMQLKVFEATIVANTADDEPFAPPIRIINTVDDEMTPPIEFHYSNLVWHGDGVPLPDFDQLPHCDCEGGKCDPNSKTCSCVKRQRSYVKIDGYSGFLYDQNGRLRYHQWPIFECNIRCGCGDDCPNRVVQHGRKYPVNIQKTPNKGWGIFAGNKKIPSNSFIGVYSGEYITEAEAQTRGVIYNKFGRTYLFDLDSWHLHDDESGGDDSEWGSKYSVDAYHAGNFTRYLNHSCEPNCIVNSCYINESDIEKPLLTMFTCRDVQPGEELCFSYFGFPDDDSQDEEEDEGHEDAVYARCQCGAKKCKGRMWS